MFKHDTHLPDGINVKCDGCTVYRSVLRVQLHTCVIYLCALCLPRVRKTLKEAFKEVELGRHKPTRD